MTGTLTLWLLDTRPLWPGASITEAVRPPLPPQAAPYLALLPTQDQHAILSKLRPADARMALASALLKRLYIARTLSLPWPSITLTRRPHPTHGKPTALLPSGAPAPVDFNVSHHAGLVVLAGHAGPAARVAVDVTAADERGHDLDTIDAVGVDGFVDVFAEVFGAAERRDIAGRVDRVVLPDGRTVAGAELGVAEGCVRRGERVALPAALGGGVVASDCVVEAKRRRFYAFFAYKEAYIKLEGEALLAPWLRELEFRNVKSAMAASGEGPSLWGERVDDVEIWLHGRRVEDVRMDLRAYDQGFQIATAVKGDAGIDIKDVHYKVLDLERDVLDYIRAHAHG